jgi:tRNA-dihydrouridine synthase
MKTKSLFLAPMEGITDDTYRKIVGHLYPEWDHMACDFLRVPSGGKYPIKHLIKHFGAELFENKYHLDKTAYQILTSQISKTSDIINDLNELGFKWIDLNLGCPSKQVVKRKGGSFLLSDTKVLRSIIKEIRENYPHRFTVKIRVGFKDDTNFEEIITLLNEEKVDAITVHGRTREQLYKGIANWDYIKKAVELSSVPIIANGDIWTCEDIDRVYEYTNCHSVMIARGAMKKPWLSKVYREGLTDSDEFTIGQVNLFLGEFRREMTELGYQDKSVLTRYKSFSRYMFDDLTDGDKIKSSLLRSSSLNDYLAILNSL